MEINFTIKQVKLIQDLIKEGFKIKKYNGTQVLLSNGITSVEITN